MFWATYPNSVVTINALTFSVRVCARTRFCTDDRNTCSVPVIQSCHYFLAEVSAVGRRPRLRECNLPQIPWLVRRQDDFEPGCINPFIPGPHRFQASRVAELKAQAVSTEAPPLPRPSAAPEAEPWRWGSVCSAILQTQSTFFSCGPCSRTFFCCSRKRLHKNKLDMWVSWSSYW